MGEICFLSADVLHNVPRRKDIVLKGRLAAGPLTHLGLRKIGYYERVSLS